MGSVRFLVVRLLRTLVSADRVFDPLVPFVARFTRLNRTLFSRPGELRPNPLFVSLRVLLLSRVTPRVKAFDTWPRRRVLTRMFVTLTLVRILTSGCLSCLQMAAMVVVGSRG